MDIEINVKKINGYPQLIMIFKDNGLGMTYDQLKNNFWDLVIHILVILMKILVKKDMDENIFKIR